VLWCSSTGEPSRRSLIAAHSFGFVTAFAHALENSWRSWRASILARFSVALSMSCLRHPPVHMTRSDQASSIHSRSSRSSSTSFAVNAFGMRIQPCCL
jgi:hypothetical protein